MIEYRGQRVLVLGGLGFIGTNLVDALTAAGAEVTIVTPSRGRHHDAAVEREARGVRVVEADIRHGGAMNDAVARQHVVFDLAGQSGAVCSMEDPWTDLDVNCRGTLVLLEALQTRNPDAKLVFVGSRLEYGRAMAIPVDEDAATDPLCIHGVHKLAAEKYLRVYARLFRIRFAVARVTNPFGPGQPSSRTAYGVVNRMIHLALSDEVLSVYGDGAQRRDYIYIDDVVGALLALGVSPASDGQIYNVGTGAGTRIIDMARAIVAVAGGGRIEFAAWPPLAEQIETGDFIADISKIRRELGWEPAMTLDEGLRRTVAFYRAHIAS